MFCPRCGRPVSRTANFCGGCGLPRAEIERMAQLVAQPEEKPVQPEINDINATLSQLEGDLTGVNPVENYTTDVDVNTNNDEISLPETENNETVTLEFEDITQQKSQSQYSANAPVHPYYTQAEKTVAQQPAYTAPVHTQPVKDQNLSTVDFVWMLLISGIPVIGLLYLIYQGFIQQDNVNRRSWARATMIISVFAFVLAMVFYMGLMMTSLMYW